MATAKTEGRIKAPSILEGDIFEREAIGSMTTMRNRFALIDHSVRVLAASHSGVEYRSPTNPKPRG